MREKPGYDHDRVDDTVLALLCLGATGPDPRGAARAWKVIDSETLKRLYRKGFIEKPLVRNMDLTLTPDGYRRARELFAEYFEGDPGPGPSEGGPET